jgi:hypothetical protein
MKNLALLIEVLDEAMRLLPPTVPSFTELKTYEPLLDIRRRKRVDAHGLKTRRSKAFNTTTRGVDDEVHKTT